MLWYLYPPPASSSSASGLIKSWPRISWPGDLKIFSVLTWLGLDWGVKYIYLFTVKVKLIYLDLAWLNFSQELLPKLFHCLAINSKHDKNIRGSKAHTKFFQFFGKDVRKLNINCNLWIKNPKLAYDCLKNPILSPTMTGIEHAGKIMNFNYIFTIGLL